MSVSSMPVYRPSTARHPACRGKMLLLVPCLTPVPFRPVAVTPNWAGPEAVRSVGR